jgi:hypothetical protein
VVLDRLVDHDGISQTGVALVLLTHQSPVLLLPLAAFSGMFQAVTTPTLRGIIPILATAFGTGPVAVTGGILTITAMLVPLLLRSLRRIEIPAATAH